MPNYKILIEYDGTGFAGWQFQPDQPSVQGHLQHALQKLTGEKVRIYCSGRTDAGVHAWGQVASFTLEKAFPTESLRGGLNFHLETPQISVLKVDEVGDEFHARFSAKGRRYRYHIVNRSSPIAILANRAWHVKPALDVAAMQERASYLIGYHDFSSFRDSQCQAKSPLKTLDRLDVTVDGEHIYVDVEAISFLHHMVRNLTGTLVKVGNGNWQAQEVKQVLAAKDRKAGGPTAPAHGLYFCEVKY